MCAMMPMLRVLFSATCLGIAVSCRSQFRVQRSALVQLFNVAVEPTLNREPEPTLNDEH
jgi:hypothetical protein